MLSQGGHTGLIHLMCAPTSLVIPKIFLVLIAADWEFSSEDSKLVGYGRNTAILQKCSCMQVLSDGNIDTYLETAPNSVAKGHLDEISVSVSFSKVT